MPLSNTYKQLLGGGNKPTYVPPVGESIAPAPSSATRTPAPANQRGLAAYGNLSKILGGGQYNIGVNPNELIQDKRGFNSFEERQAVRGPYAGKDVGIDHKFRSLLEEQTI